MIDIKKEQLDIIEEKIREAGLYARTKQKGISFELKEDGTPVTEVDLKISDMILSALSSLFPEANLISEETKTEFKKDAPYSFVLDPIDGTDVYSQGLPSFAIALAILDKTFIPVGAMIYAPRFGVGEDDLFLRLDPNSKPMLNGKKLRIKTGTNINQIAMSSKGQKNIDFDNFDGKIRTFGSTILHLIAPVVFNGIDASITAPCYVWDIAASHAILLSCGFEIKYEDLSDICYDESLLVERKMLKDYVYAAHPKAMKKLQSVLPIIR